MVSKRVNDLEENLEKLKTEIDVYPELNAFVSTKKNFVEALGKDLEKLIKYSEKKYDYRPESSVVVNLPRTPRIVEERIVEESESKEKSLSPFSTHSKSPQDTEKIIGE
eukprot:UN27970